MRTYLRRAAHEWDLSWGFGVVGGAAVYDLSKEWWAIGVVVACGYSARLLIHLALSLSNGGQAVPVDLVGKPRPKGKRK